VIGGLLAGLLAGYAVALPLGAVGSYLITLTARSSLRIGAAAALGVAVMDGVYALLAVLGGAAVSSALAPLAGPLRWTAVLVLLVLAGRALVSTSNTSTGPCPPAPRAIVAFGRFTALTAINPTTLISFTALVIGGRLGGAGLGGAGLGGTEQLGGAGLGGAGLGGTEQLGGTGQLMARALFVLGTFAASVSWQLCLAVAGTLLGRLLSRRRAMLGYCSAVLLAVLALILATRPAG